MNTPQQQPLTEREEQLLEALQDICAMVVLNNHTRTDILNHALEAIERAERKN